MVLAGNMAMLLQPVTPTKMTLTAMANQLSCNLSQVIKWPTADVSADVSASSCRAMCAFELSGAEMCGQAA